MAIRVNVLYGIPVMTRKSYVHFKPILGKPVHQFRAYNTYMNMLDRCYNPKSSGYQWYGARGISVCRRWRDSFLNFLEDMGERPIAYTLDRIDSNGHYCRENCRWLDKKRQHLNKRSNILFTFQGETLCLSEWAERFGLSYNMVFKRVHNRKWSLEKALKTPYQRGY